MWANEVSKLVVTEHRSTQPISKQTREHKSYLLGRKRPPLELDNDKGDLSIIAAGGWISPVKNDRPSSMAIHGWLTICSIVNLPQEKKCAIHAKKQAWWVRETIHGPFPAVVTYRLVGSMFKRPRMKLTRFSSKLRGPRIASLKFSTHSRSLRSNFGGSCVCLRFAG